MAIIAKLKSGIKYISAVLVAGGVAFLAISPSDTVVIHPDRNNIQSFEIHKNQYIVRDLRVDVVDGGEVIIDSRVIIPSEPTGIDNMNVFLNNGLVTRVERNGEATSTTADDMQMIENALSVIVLELNN
mgnify:CR=1 FL=1